MNYLVWRQQRTSGAVAFAILALVAVVLVPTGIHAAGIYHAALADCSKRGAACGGFEGLFANYGPLFQLVGLTLAVPAVLGMFWGAPLVASEIEHGTHQFVWTQGVTRRRWLAVKVAWLTAAAAIWGAGIGLLIEWWSGPENSVYRYRFDLGHFDSQGIVPIGYAVFAVALGTLAGLLIRRVLPALAVTLAGFLAWRFFVDYVLRRRYMAPVTRVLPLGSAAPVAKGSYWTVSTSFLGPGGRPLSDLRFTPFSMPAPCRPTAPLVDPEKVSACLGAHGYRTVTTYQPADRFWTFQAIELGIYLVLASALFGVALWLVTRREA